ncbi:MAG TPA: zinc ribbon domain-containing protein [Ktedonobacteraceae bacterium]|jgi:hypothetical protein|nr:zinc ribbon domain-containing protein [Ktedonobacteraceae bacterium]
MQCDHCRAEYSADDVFCHQCGADLTVPSTSLVPSPSRLPAVLYSSPVPRGVAASVGAVALGLGIELLRRGVVAMLSKPSDAVDQSLPALNGMKDILFPQKEKSVKRLKKGYEVEETVIYMRRVIRR